MTPIQTILSRVTENSTKAKFYRTNREIFLRYFNSLAQYEALIAAGDFKKMQQIIKENSPFRLDEFAEEIKQKIEVKK